MRSPARWSRSGAREGGCAVFGARRGGGRRGGEGLGGFFLQGALLVSNISLAFPNIDSYMCVWLFLYLFSLLPGEVKTNEHE